jgi:uncharacterized protein YjdB
MEKTGLIIASVLPTDATNKKVTWTSDDPEIATVDESGLVTGVSAGQVNITCTTEDGGFTAICVVAVNATLITQITLNTSERSIDRGDTFQLVPTIIPDNASIPTLQWSSNNTDVVTVSNSGLLTAVGAGTATVTVEATDGSATTATATITIVVPVASVSVSPTSMTLTF